MAEYGDDENTKYDLSDKTVAILATDGFEQAELLEPRKALRDSGATVHVISIPETGETVRGWRDGHWARRIDVDGVVGEVDSGDYDALVLPGGVMNPDRLRRNEDAVEFVRAFFRDSKPVAAICHGPWLLVEADAVRQRRVTSWPSIRTDLENAGADWVDEEVVVDSGLVTSRKPEDLPAFNRKVCEEIHEGAHAGQAL